MNTKQKISDIIKFINDKATYGFSSKNKEQTEGEKEEKKVVKSGLLPSNKTPKKPIKQITVPEPFNLSINKPKVLLEPIAIDNRPKITPLPLANYKKTSLDEIEKERKNRLEVIKKNIIERTKKDRSLLTLETEKRPTNLEKIKEEVENEIQKTIHSILNSPRMLRFNL